MANASHSLYRDHAGIAGLAPTARPPKRRGVPAWPRFLLLGSFVAVVALAGCGGGAKPSSSGATPNLKAGSGNALTAFCADSQFLTNQSEEPGIDNFDPAQPLHPDPALVKSNSVSLDKLAGEAPAQIKADLTTWAAFTDQLAGGASQSDLTALYSAAKSAADNVESYLSSASNSCLGNSTGTSTTGPGSTDTSTTGSTASLTAFCNDVQTVIGDVSNLLTTSTNGGTEVSASLLAQATTDAQHLANEAPATVQSDAEAVANDLASPNGANNNLVGDEASLSLDHDTDCPGGLDYTGGSGDTGSP